MYLDTLVMYVFNYNNTENGLTDSVREQQTGPGEPGEPSGEWSFGLFIRDTGTKHTFRMFEGASRGWMSACAMRYNT